MSICSDKHHDKPSSCRQIFVHVRESETPMRDLRRLLLDILMQYRQVDKVGNSLGVLDKTGSFSDAVSWCSILGKMDHDKDSLDKASKQHLNYSVDYLEELLHNLENKVVLQIQKTRDKWMRRVLLWDVIAFVLLLAMVSGGIYLSGYTINGEGLAAFIQQRPVFSALTGLSVVGVLLGLHYIVRRMVMNRMLEKLEDKLPPGMSLVKAMRRNTRIHHSIFRPDPVGWNYSQRKRLNAIKQVMVNIREQLKEVLEHYPDQKAA